MTTLSFRDAEYQFFQGTGTGKSIRDLKKAAFSPQTEAEFYQSLVDNGKTSADVEGFLAS